METLPFNACDYRCERCLVTDRCAVFRDGAERDARNCALGRDTEGLEAAWRDVGEVFDETKDLLDEQAEEVGVDLDDLPDAGLHDRYETTKKDPLYLSAFDFMAQVQEFLKTAEPAISSKENDLLEDIRWHHTIVPVKVFRAVRSSAKPEMQFDAANSAAVARNSLSISIMAFDALSPLYPELAGECKRLSLSSAQLRQLLRARFPGKT